MGDIFNFLKDTVDDSVVIQFLRGKVAKGGNAIAERSGSIIKEEQRPLKEPTIYDWKLIMYIGIIILIVIMGFFFYIMPIVARRFPDTFFTELYAFFLFALFYNLVQAIYTVSYYYYRISVVGMPGPRGKVGKRGEKGETTSCNVDKKYTSTFTFDEKPIKRELKVELNIPESILLDEDESRYGWKKMNGTIGINRFLSGNSRECRKINGEQTGNLDKCSNNLILNLDEKKVIKADNNDTNQPFNGIIIDVDNQKEKINSFQFFYDDQKHPMETLNIKLFDKRYGSKRTKGKVYTCICPPGGAFYKAEVLVSEDKKQIVNGSEQITPVSELKGVALQCRNIKTGELMKLRNNEGKYVNRVFFGRNPTPGDKLYRYITAECGFVSDSSMKLKIPGFFSGVSVLHSRDQVYGFGIDQCSYYRAKE